MEPIGTTTKFYPFLKQETRERIDALVEEAENYRDFTKKLIKSIEQESMASELSQFAVIQTYAAFQYDDEVWTLVLPRCDEDIVTRPWMYSNNPQIQHQEHQENFNRVVENALTSDVPDWIRLHLHFIGAWRAYHWPDCEKHLDAAKNLIEKQKELECFLPQFCSINGVVKRREGELDDLLQEYQDGLEAAQRHSDVLWIGEMLQAKAMVIVSHDSHAALEILNEALEMYKSLGEIASRAATIGDIGYVSTLMGEYDLALKLYSEGVDISTSAMKMGQIAAENLVVCIAGIYCDLNQPKQAIEWISWFNEVQSWGRNPRIELVLARALIQKGRLDEVPEHLEFSHGWIMHRGIDGELATYNFVEGLHEFAKGDSKNALRSIEQALVEDERLNYELSINRSLLTLAQIEVASAMESKTEKDVNSSGPWMRRLEARAKEKDFPGIRMQHSLLKAEYQAMIGEPEAAQLTLQDALTFTDSPGVKTLRMRIKEKLAELDPSIEA
ncbi:MAG: hypothetical protein ACFFAY_00765 [Promethearchaeota archaeon]